MLIANRKRSLRAAIANGSGPAARFVIPQSPCSYSGEFRRKVEPLVAAVALCSTFFAFLYEWTRRGGILDIEAAIGHTLDVVLDGLSERRRRAR